MGKAVVSSFWLDYFCEPDAGCNREIHGSQIVKEAACKIEHYIHFGLVPLILYLVCSSNLDTTQVVNAFSP